MRLLLTTDDFQIHGISYAGFPLLLDDRMNNVEPASSFLLDICLRSGRVASPASWKKYGRDLYDFFSFVSSNGLDWKLPPAAGHLGAVELYRDWSLNECGLNRSTINHRLRTVRRFYDWCRGQGLIDRLPYHTVSIAGVRPPAFLAHTNAAGGTVESAHFMLRELQRPPRLLSLEQCRRCIGALSNPTHRLIFWLMLATGLRNEEVRTLPEIYLFDPKYRRDLDEKAKVRICLDPTQMRTKGSRKRLIDFPISLMSTLWWWSVKVRPARARRSAHVSPACFLTTQGNAYSESAIQRVFTTLSDSVGFNVTPHMLRHCYATYTLYGLRKRGYQGDPLLYVRDRLGHSSVNTTTIYLHMVEQLESDLVLRHEAEIDALFGAAHGSE